MRTGIVLLFLFVALFSEAQEKVYTLQPGERIMDVLKGEDIYLYPSFQPGRVFFKSNETAAGRMNLNFLTGEFHFIDSKGDTLALDNEQTIKHLHLGRDTFFFDDGFLKLLQSNDQWKLAQKQLIRMVKKEQSGAYDQSMPSSAVTYTSIRMGNQQMDNLVVREKTTMMRQTEYFIGDKFNRFVELNKKNVGKLFGKHEKKVEAWLNEHPVNFRKEEEVRKLFAFLETL